MMDDQPSIAGVSLMTAVYDMASLFDSEMNEYEHSVIIVQRQQQQQGHSVQHKYMFTRIILLKSYANNIQSVYGTQ